MNPRDCTDEELVEWICAERPGWDGAWEELIQGGYSGPARLIERTRGFNLIKGRYGGLLRHIARESGYNDFNEIFTELFYHLRGRDGTWNRLRSYRKREGATFKSWLSVVTGRLARGRTKREQAKAFVEVRQLGASPEQPPDRVPKVIGLDGLKGAEDLFAKELEDPRQTKQIEYVERREDLVILGRYRSLLQSAIEQLRDIRCKVLLRKHYWGEKPLATIAKELGIRDDAARQIHHRNLESLHQVIQRVAPELVSLTKGE
jgi:RNA polymerase sigma factor (sigma-70 family)